MANPNKHESQLSDASNNPMLGNQRSNVADPASTLTSTLSAGAAVATAITFTTDAPSAANGAVTIADGDASLNVAEVMEVFIEFESSIAGLVTLANELRTDHATFITDITDNRTAINAILDVLEEMGFMVET